MDGANSSGDRIASFTIVDNDLERLKASQPSLKRLIQKELPLQKRWERI